MYRMTVLRPYQKASLDANSLSRNAASNPVDTLNDFHKVQLKPLAAALSALHEFFKWAKIMADLHISISHCNSIDSADISISKNRLNIKYGPNGLGKSTIARAILYASSGGDKLEKLTQFKNKGRADKKPTVTGMDEVSNVLIFDENYISQFTFQRDEVLKNSFDVFVNTEGFQAERAEIEEILYGIKASFRDSDDIDQAITDMRALREAFSTTKGGALSKSSRGFKAVGSGNFVENIPTPLIGFKDFIQGENTPKWITWQAGGNAFLDSSDNCPYCSSSLKEEGRKEVVREVSKKYNSKSVEHLNTLREAIDRLGAYFSEETRDALDKITKSKIEMSPEQSTFIANLSETVGTLLFKLENLRAISFDKLKDIEKLDVEIAKLKIDLGLLSELDTEKTRSIVAPVNSQIDDLTLKIGQLNGKINIHKATIAKTIESNQQSINEFLLAAGYKYSVRIIPTDGEYKMKLVHDDFSDHIETASEHLSYGERNAFALVLFMHVVRREKPDLAIFDDPVSSFDKTKKFAIFQQLFRGKNGIRDITSLMLTHDLEPAIEIVKISSDKWKTAENKIPTASYLSSSAGNVTEKIISPNDIKSFSEICLENASQSEDPIVRCIYLRRYYEVLANKGLEYNLLSSLIHGRAQPDIMDGGSVRTLTDEEISRATQGVRAFYPEFDYIQILAAILDVDDLKKRYANLTVGYEKLQIFRVISERGNAGVQLGDNNQGNVLKKFVDEAFHIESEYIMQLNPRVFDSVPTYVIDGLSASIGVD
jgi:energy-coupling factor transporter ATP-binding protein EcfA2